MKTLILGFILSLSLQSWASENEAVQETTVEAWLSETSFNGKTFDYSYTVYDEGIESKEKVEIGCEFSEFQKQPILSAIKITILITAQFKDPGQELKKSGSVDIRSIIESCRQKLPAEMAQRRMPVQIKLPPVSTPSL